MEDSSPICDWKQHGNSVRHLLSLSQAVSNSKHHRPARAMKFFISYLPWGVLYIKE